MKKQTKQTTQETKSMQATQIAGKSKDVMTRQTRAIQTTTYVLMAITDMECFQHSQISRNWQILRMGFIKYKQHGITHGHDFVIAKLNGNLNKRRFHPSVQYDVVHNDVKFPWQPCAASSFRGLKSRASKLSYYAALAPLFKTHDKDDNNAKS